MRAAELGLYEWMMGVFCGCWGRMDGSIEFDSHCPSFRL